MPLRHTLKKQRQQLDTKQQQSASQQIISQLQPLLKDATHIATYLATRGEINLLPLLKALHRQHKQVYLPVVQPDGTLHFIPYHANSPLDENHYGILEPHIDDDMTPYPADKLDVVVLPLVGCDHDGYRLGMGKGYYDKTFAFLNQPERATSPQLIGVGYDFQYVEKVPHNPWDVRLDTLITELRRCDFMSHVALKDFGDQGD